MKASRLKIALSAAAIFLAGAFPVFAATTYTPSGSFSIEAGDHITFHCSDSGGVSIDLFKSDGNPLSSGLPLETSIDVSTLTNTAGSYTAVCTDGTSDDPFTGDCSSLTGCEASPSFKSEISGITLTNGYSCGDGVVSNNPNAGEQCDDGNLIDGDGCNSSCQIETGYSCSGSPSVCTITPPNGLNFTPATSALGTSAQDAMTWIIWLMLKVLGAVMIVAGVYRGFRAIQKHFGLGNAKVPTGTLESTKRSLRDISLPREEILRRRKNRKADQRLRKAIARGRRAWPKFRGPAPF